MRERGRSSPPLRRVPEPGWLRHRATLAPAKSMSHSVEATNSECGCGGEGALGLARFRRALRAAAADEPNSLMREALSTSRAEVEPRV